MYILEWREDMKKIVVIYSPICEATGAFVSNLSTWLYKTNVDMEVYSYNNAPKEYIELIPSTENCFIEVFYNGIRIDSVPLHRNQLFLALGIEDKSERVEDIPEIPNDRVYTESEVRNHIFDGSIEFIPITKDTYLEEMSMCLHHYPMGNPMKVHHTKCIAIKEGVYNDVWKKENVAGIYAKMRGNVVGLLEVFPREILNKYGFMTGTEGENKNTLSIACYEVAYGLPRTIILDELMYHLLEIKHMFSRNYIEGVGILECNEGFNPYWVYEKYGFKRVSKKSENVLVMGKRL